MIKIEHVDIYGWEACVRGMRNSWLSYDKSDSMFKSYPHYHDINNQPIDICYDEQLMKTFGVNLGPNDLKLMKTLSNTGRGSERKYLRYIAVTADITAPLFWYKEMDTYKVGTVANSTSTMHSIAAEPFTVNDFSIEQLAKGNLIDENGNLLRPDLKAHYKHMMNIIASLNNLRDLYLKTKDKTYWRCMIEMLPSSYNQKRTVLLNYEVLAAQYKDRKNHKLNEWRSYCEWIESLPYSELITGERKDCIKYEKTPLDDEPVDLRNFDYIEWVKEQNNKLIEEERDGNTKKGD